MWSARSKLRNGDRMKRDENISPLDEKPVHQRVRPEMAGPMTSSADREGDDFQSSTIQRSPSLSLPLNGEGRNVLKRRNFLALLATAARGARAAQRQSADPYHRAVCAGGILGRAGAA